MARNTSAASRRATWHPTPPPPPSPKILHFPRSRRTHRKKTKPATLPDNVNPLVLMHQRYLSDEGKLENLFDQENDEWPTTHVSPVDLLNPNSETSAVWRRERVEEHEEEEEACGQGKGGGGTGGFLEEKWRFQAEILRAECNFLRMERELALKKLEKNRVKVERTLRSAVQTLSSGRQKIVEGKNVNAVLEEEIEDLVEKLEELRNSSRDKDYEVRNCNNFDKKASLLQRRLEKLGGLSEQICVKELQEFKESSLPDNTSRDIDKEGSIPNCKSENECTDVDNFRKMREGQSKGMLDKADKEYSSLGSATANSSVASSPCTSKRIEFPKLPGCSSRQLYQEPILQEIKCSGRCKAIVRRIVEQVRAETEQWCQMQEMLRRVRQEMEEVQASRDFWENHARNSDYEIQSLMREVEEWKERALGYENKATELQLQLSVVRSEIQKSKTNPKPAQNCELMANQGLPVVPLGKQIIKEKLGLSCRVRRNFDIDEQNCKFENATEELNIDENEARTLPPLSLGKQLAKEKKMLLRQLKEDRRASKKDSKQEPWTDAKRKPHSNSMNTGRSPLRDIGNSSHSNRAAFAFHSPEGYRTRESFRK